MPDKSALRIVAIGGGTGLSTLLKGLKKYALPTGGAKPRPPVAQITAVVTVTDDGGSSGRLRRVFDILPPGDIRNCLVALSEDEAMLARLFQYRFPDGSGLKGHSFGNLFLAALTNITGDFAHAVSFASEILAIAGRIHPSTAANVVLEATLENGEKVIGETRISRSKVRIKSLALSPHKPKPIEDTLRAIEQADLITLGPGSLFTSVIPNLLVDGIPEAIAKSNALTAYFTNLMWQPGETEHFSAADHLQAILDHSRQDLVDYIVVNTKNMSPDVLDRYATQRALPVDSDFDRLKKMRVSVVSEILLAETEKIRHDPDRAADVAIKLARLGRRRRLIRETRSDSGSM